jgi:TctA family transporter
MMLALSKPLSKNLNRINRKYMKAFGFCLGCALIVCFTGWQGVLLASVSTCIGLLSKRLKIRSTHLMGVLILPSILPAII